ncbi:MAG: hypothetical protein Kow0068_09100 [Marinilabiliales bacterium]
MIIVLFLQIRDLKNDLSNIRKGLNLLNFPKDYHEKEKRIFQYMMEQARGQSSSTLPNHLLDEKIKSFLFNNIVDSLVYVHYTAYKEVADKIITEGFQYRESFHKTAQNIINDPVQIMNNHLNYKSYGHYIVVICFPENIINQLKEIMQKKKNAQLLLENILSDYIGKDENDDNIYLLPPVFIKGYFDYTTGKITENEQFNPVINVKTFEDKINTVFNDN